MNNSRYLRFIALVVRIIGALFLLYGLVNLASEFTKWIIDEEAIIITFEQPIYLLLLVGGCFLLFLRKAGLEILFIVFRLYMLIGSVAAILSLVTMQFKTTLFIVGFLALIGSLMFFLSRNSTKSVLDDPKRINNPNNET